MAVNLVDKRRPHGEMSYLDFSYFSGMGKMCFRANIFLYIYFIISAPTVIPAQEDKNI